MVRKKVPISTRALWRVSRNEAVETHHPFWCVRRHYPPIDWGTQDERVVHADSDYEGEAQPPRPHFEAAPRQRRGLHGKEGVVSGFLRPRGGIVPQVPIIPCVASCSS